MHEVILSIALHKTLVPTRGLVFIGAAVVNSSSKGSANHIIGTSSPGKGNLAI